MKTNAIIRIIIWSIVLVFLVGVLAAFIADELYLNDDTVATTPVEWESSILLAPTEEVYATWETEAPVQSLENNEKLIVSPDKVQEIKIDWVAGDIIILPGEVEEITISESDGTDEKYAMV